MPGILSEAELHFGKADLYDILNISKTSSNAEVKKAYYKLSLLVHPDKSTENDREKATKKFQVLGKIYSVLSDANLRAAYDETGTIDEEDSDLEQVKDWLTYWRNVFPKITSEDIKEFVDKYKNSDEEKEELIRLYKLHKGDMDEILNWMMCSSCDDEPRFREIIDELIQEDELEDFEVYSNEAPKKKKARTKKYEKEKEEAEEMLKEFKKKNNIAKGEDGLRALIAANKKSRAEQADSFIASLEEKYGEGGSGGRQTRKSTKAAKSGGDDKPRNRKR